MAKTAKTPPTLDELKKRAELALNVPALMEIVRNAPPTKEGKVNLTWARDQAYEYAVKETGDLKDAKKLADSTRVLAMLRRDHEEEFERLVAQERQPKSNAKLETEREPFHEIPFRTVTINFLWELLPALFDTANHSRKIILSEPLIYVLEEKFGLKVKVCGNCGYYRGLGKKSGLAAVLCYAPQNTEIDPRELLQYLFNSCPNWTQEEVYADKKEN